MKTRKLILSIMLMLISIISIAQAGQWKLAGNSLAGTEKFGSTNNQPVRFFTDNKLRISLTNTGNLSIASDQSSIQFALPGASPKPMMYMFPSGTANTNRMVIAHSPSFENFGLQYNDVADRFDFLSGGASIFNVNLGTPNVGVNSSFNVSGTSTFTGNINVSGGGRLGIGISTPKTNLHIVRGISGVSTLNSNSPLVVENSTDNFINVLAPANNAAGILFGNPLNAQDGGIIYNGFGVSRGFQFNTNNNTTRMSLTNEGYLGVGTKTPATEFTLVHDVTAFFESPGTHGLRIQNSVSNNDWTMYVNPDGSTLDFSSKDEEMGFFDNPSGAYISISDARRKKDVETAQEVLQKLMKLDVKKYHFLENKPGDKKYYGMIAQEVEKIFPEVVYHKKSGGKDLYMMNYNSFGVIAIKAIQEQQATIDSQKSDIKELKTIVARLEEKIEALSGSTQQNSLSVITGKVPEKSSAYLKQNAPNPFNSATSISYYVPESKNAVIEIISSTGQIIKSYPVTQKGNGQLFIEAGTLKTGSYYYILKVNGVKVDSKQMMLVK